MKVKNILPVLAGLILLVFPLYGKAETISVKTQGVASLKNTKTDIARDRSLENALRLAVEKAVGTMIETETVVQNHKLLSDKIYSKSSGYISNYEILDEKKEENLYKTDIKAEVKKGGLQGDLKAIGLLMKRVGKPRVAVMINEKNAGRETQYGGSRTYDSDSVEYREYIRHYKNNISQAETLIIKAFRRKGFHVVDPSVIRSNLNKKAAYEAFRGNDKKASTLADSFGADVLVIGEAMIASNSIPDTQMMTVTSTLSARAIRSGNGEIIATANSEGKGSHLSYSSGYSKSIKKASRLLAQKTISGILEKWKEETSGTRMISLTAGGLNSKQIEEFKTALINSIRGIKEIYQRSFAGTTLQLDLEYEGNGTSLAAALENAKMKDFKIKLVSSDRDNVNLKILKE